MIPRATSSSRTGAGGGPKFAIPSPETSITLCAAGSGMWSKAAAAASIAAPIAVRPCDVRVVARTAAANAAALARLATRVQPTVTAILSGSDHSSTRTSIPPGTAAIASTSFGVSKARAIPSCCKTYRSVETLSDTSTASTRASAAACAADAAVAANRTQKAKTIRIGRNLLRRTGAGHKETQRIKLVRE